MSKNSHKSKLKPSNQRHEVGDSTSHVSPYDDKQRNSFICLIPSILIVVISIFTNRVHQNYILDETFTFPNESIPDIITSERRCKRYLARSSIPNAGLGIFTTEYLSRQTLIQSPGDIVIHLTDINPYTAQSLKMLLYDYAWDSQDFEGMYEGKMVYSIVAGVGMLANGHPTLFNTDQTFSPSIDHAGVTRMDSPTAGSFSHYHNYSFVATSDIVAGGEILMNYGNEWFQEREKINRIDEWNAQNITQYYRSVDWLMENGICLDLLEVRPSTKKWAGRGAFATEDIKEGNVVAPVPVIPIEKDSLNFYRYKESKDGTDELETLQQLLLNYCYGHQFSSILLFPYGHMVNFINHDSRSPNIALRWSESSQHDISSVSNISIRELKSLDRSGLMLEFIALRDIKQDEELFFDYGSQWEYLFQKHVREWKPPINETDHAYAQDLDLLDEVIRTVQEQRYNPYHSSIFTSCYYKFSKAISLGRSNFIWRKHHNIFHSENLRPCVILDRVETNHTDAKSKTLYTVAIKNRFGLQEKEIIPEGQKHIVVNVPRNAIRFSQKIYTSDQHTSGFRSQIFLTDDIFPIQWIDLKK